MSDRMSIPQSGRDHNDLLEEMQGLRSGDARYKEGRTWSLVYYVDPDHHHFLEKAHNSFFSENGLNPMAFKSLKRMEAEKMLSSFQEGRAM